MPPRVETVSGADSLGTLIEDMIAPRGFRLARAIFADEDAQTCAIRVKRRHPTVPGELMEIDLLAIGPSKVLVVEVKRRMDASKASEYRQKLVRLPEFFPELSSKTLCAAAASVYLAPTSDHRPPTTDLRPPTSDHRPPTSDHRPLEMSQIVLEVPNESLIALRGSPEKVGARLLLAAAVKLYEIGELSSGAAANLAGVPRVAFLSKLADFGVDSFRLGNQELAEETRLA